MTFLAAETADIAVYNRLRSRAYISAVCGSSVVSAIVDSILSLRIAFGIAQVATGTAGMTVGKLEASIITLAAVGTTFRLMRTFAHPDQRETAHERRRASEASVSPGENS